MDGRYSLEVKRYAADTATTFIPVIKLAAPGRSMYASLHHLRLDYSQTS